MYVYTSKRRSACGHMVNKKDTIPTLIISKEGKYFIVRDENTTTIYGPLVSTQEEAEDLLISWNNYYDPKY